MKIRLLTLALIVLFLGLGGCAGTGRKAPPPPDPARVGVQLEALEAPLTRADAIARELQRREKSNPRL